MPKCRTRPTTAILPTLGDWHLCSLYSSRRIRAVLVALALVTAVVCLSLSSWGHSFWSHARIRIAGGSVLVRWNVEGDLRPALFDNPASVEAIWLNNPQFDDKKVFLLKGYTGLFRLSLSETKIGSSAIKELDCRCVMALYLQNTNVDDEGLRWLAERFRQLHTVNLTGTRITDDGVHWLCGLKPCSQVYLNETVVSDRGLQELEKAPHGLTVYLIDTNVTQNGIEALVRVRPDIRCFLGSRDHVSSAGRGQAPLTTDAKENNPQTKKR